MGLKEGVLLLFSVLGGVALFILGMGIMTDGLRLAAGDKLRMILAKATGNRYAALLFGSLLGFLIHSTASTVMMVGFVNAGLMRLFNAIPLLMGASVGTTLSMQLISFQLTDYAFLAVAVGFLFQMIAPQPPVKQLGRALLGFGLLFLGLEFTGDAIHPYREQLEPWLARIDGSTWGGMLAGIAIATAVTLIIQSSGATIGMLFVLISAGMFTSLEQAFPIVLGAHIGTSGTALLVSIGTNLEARRAAVANLLFQIFNVALAVVAAPLFIRLIGMTSEDLVRQTANLHTAVMLTAVVILAPVLPVFVGLVRRLMPDKGATPASSFLERDYLRKPERAIYATVQELGRMMAVCRESSRLMIELYDKEDRRKAKRLRLNEEIVNEVKRAVKAYLGHLTAGYLSRRQALMAQYLSRGVDDVERIGDHIESLYYIRQRQLNAPGAAFDEATEKEFREMFEEAERVLEVTAESLSPETKDFGETGEKIIEMRDHYDERSLEAMAAVNKRIVNHELHPMIGLYFSEYASALDRIVKHCKMMAREQQQPFFRIKPQKLENVRESNT